MNRMKFLRSTTTGNTPPAGTADDAGRIAFNIPDRKLWVYRDDGTPRLVARDIRAHDNSRAYAQGDMVVEGDVLYRAPASIAAGAFDPAAWAIVSDFRGDAILREPETAGAATITFQDDLTMRVEASAGQSANLAEWVGPDGAARAAIDARGVPAAGMGAGRFTVNQTAHSFTAVGQAARYDGGAWVLARANSVNTYGVALVAEIIDANNVVFATSGEIEGLESGAFSGGVIESNTRYFVSTSNAGELTAVEPAEPAEQNPVLYVADAPDGHVQIWRPGGGGEGGGAGVTITQDPNPFTAIGQAVCFTSGQYALARADDDNRAAIGVITATSGLTFSFATAGKVENIDPAAVDGSQLVPGAVYYVSASTAGQLTETRPPVDSASLAPLIEAVSADSAIVLSPTKDTSVVRNFGDQAIAGTKTFTDGVEAASYGGNGVTQSATDTTAGRLLKVGDHGLGATSGNTPQLSNIDDQDTPAGLYGVTTGSAGTRPSGASSFAFVFVERQAVSGVKQTWTNSNNSLTAFRYASGGTWGAWRELYHTGNLLGTVSQSGGVPTGALIERGSNSNGEYVRFADGTQICTNDNVASVSVEDEAGNWWRSGSFTWDFPVDFSHRPFVYGGIGGTSGTDTNRLVGAYGQQSASQATFRVFSGTGASGTTSRIGACAVGRWF